MPLSQARTVLAIVPDYEQQVHDGFPLDEALAVCAARDDSVNDLGRR